MTRFTVVWSNEALSQLAQIWLDAADRPSITAAANRIDVELTDDPQTKGAVLSEGLRVLDVPPLHVLFFVAEQDRLVQVVLVRHSTPLVPPGANGNGLVKS